MPSYWRNFKQFVAECRCHMFGHRWFLKMGSMNGYCLRCFMKRELIEPE